MSSLVKELPTEIKEEYTNEFILLGLLYYAKRYDLKLDRMQTTKLLWKFKDLVQNNLKLQAYYSEAQKNKYGRFSYEIYDQLNNLRTADFITTSGFQPPMEKFEISEKGKTVFDKFKTHDEKERYSLGLVKTNLESVIKEHGGKSAFTLKDEDHEAVEDSHGPFNEIDEGAPLLSNLKKKDIRHKFLFDSATAMDWGLAIEIGDRKKTEDISAKDDDLPTTQKEIYDSLFS